MKVKFDISMHKGRLNRVSGDQCIILSQPVTEEFLKNRISQIAENRRNEADTAVVDHTNRKIRNYLDYYLLVKSAHHTVRLGHISLIEMRIACKDIHQLSDKTEVPEFIGMIMGDVTEWASMINPQDCRNTAILIPRFLDYMQQCVH